MPQGGPTKQGASRAWDVIFRHAANDSTSLGLLDFLHYMTVLDMWPEDIQGLQFKIKFFLILNGEKKAMSMDKNMLLKKAQTSKLSEEQFVDVYTKNRIPGVYDQVDVARGGAELTVFFSKFKFS